MIEDEHLRSMHQRALSFHGKKRPEKDPTKGSTQVIFGVPVPPPEPPLDTARMLAALKAAGYDRGPAGPPKEVRRRRRRPLPPRIPVAPRPPSHSVVACRLAAGAPARAPAVCGGARR